MNIILNKAKEPSRSFALSSVKEEIDELNTLINKANKSIDEHNEIVTNYKAQKILLIRGFWRYVLEEAKIDVKNHLKKKSDIEKAILGVGEALDDNIKKWKALDNEVKELSKNVTSVQPTVNAINQTLSSFGFSNFQIEPVNDHSNEYQIQREDGSLAHETLSEGEITFITFLYYLQRAKGGVFRRPG